MLSCASFFFFKQKTAYELRISDWSSDVCSSDLQRHGVWLERLGARSRRGGDRDAAPPRRAARPRGVATEDHYIGRPCEIEDGRRPVPIPSQPDRKSTR